MIDPHTISIRHGRPNGGGSPSDAKRSKPRKKWGQPTKVLIRGDDGAQYKAVNKVGSIHEERDDTAAHSSPSDEAAAGTDRGSGGEDSEEWAPTASSLEREPLVDDEAWLRLEQENFVFFGKGIEAIPEGEFHSNSAGDSAGGGERRGFDAVADDGALMTWREDGAGGERRPACPGNREGEPAPSVSGGLVSRSPSSLSSSCASAEELEEEGNAEDSGRREEEPAAKPQWLRNTPAAAAAAAAAAVGPSAIMRVTPQMPPLEERQGSAGETLARPCWLQSQQEQESPITLPRHQSHVIGHVIHQELFSDHLPLGPLRESPGERAGVMYRPRTAGRPRTAAVVVGMMTMTTGSAEPAKAPVGGAGLDVGALEVALAGCL